MSKKVEAPKKKNKQWPRITSRTYPSGKVGYVVNLGFVNGVRQRPTFETLEEAEAVAEQARIQRQNEGMAAFTLPQAIRVDAQKASDLLKPHGISLCQAAQYYLDHVVAFREAPDLAEIVQRMLSEAKANGRRERTLSDLKHRLEYFSESFPGARLNEISLEDLKDWLGEHDGEWASQTKINFLTKVSQLYNYAVRHGWAEKNLAQQMDRPGVEGKEPGILTVDECQRLLARASDYELLPYVALGLFAGLRTAELSRLKGTAIRLEDKSIVVGADVAKKRSRRVVEMCDALVEWLKPVLPISGLIAEPGRLRERLEGLRTAAGIAQWPHNALRHSFGSYHLALHGDSIKTAGQMGHRDSNIIHNHYKALVLKAEAEKFFALRPENPSGEKNLQEGMEKAAAN